MKKITVVTPSFNQGEYLEETIDSVLSQNDINVEYIIMDGGSTDQSVEIIKKYEKYLAYWQSKPDGGQSHAIALGFKMATGDILSWLNSDDQYISKSLKKVADYFNEDSRIKLLYSDYMLLYPDGRYVAKPKISYDFNICLNAYLMIPQPSSFWSREIYDVMGGLNVNYQSAFDYDYFLRIGHHLQGKPDSIRHIHDYWSIFRVHPESKSVKYRDQFKIERKKIRLQFSSSNQSIFRELKSKYQLARALYCFWLERGFIPVHKGNEKE